MGDPIGPRFRRANRLGRVVVGHAARSTAVRASAAVRSPEEVAAKRDEAILRLADDIVAVLGPMKGGALKIGQIIAMFDLGLSSARTRAEFSQKLAPLFDNVPAADWPTMRTQLENELGAAAGRLDIDPHPIAAASVGQVYRGTIDGRTPVAVKVQYPGIDVAVRADLKNLRLLAKFSNRTFPGTDLPALIDEIAEEVGRELDYRAEATNQSRARMVCEGHPVWTVPKVYAELSTPRVLVSELLPGRPFEALTSETAEIRDWAGEAIYRFYCGGIYDHGEFCADPHPGNVIAMADGRIGFCDFGLYVRMDQRAKTDQRDVLRAMIEQRYDDAYRISVRMGVTSVGDTGKDEVVEMMKDVAFWFLTEDEITITSKVAGKAVASLFTPGAAHTETTRHTALPAGHAFARRTELATCGLLGKLTATASWGGIAREWALDAGPSTRMGESIARWRRG